MRAPIYVHARKWLAALTAAAGIAILPVQAFAAETPFVVREWHREEGLPSEVVLDLAQDHDGYLWLTTMAGLVRFDGSDFKSYVPPESGRPNRSALIAVFAIPEGLWLVPRSGDPLYFRSGVFTPNPLPKAYSGATITAVLLAPDGSQWFALRGSVVLHRKAAIVETFDASHGLNLDAATRFATDSRGQVWITSGHFLGRYEGGTIIPIDADTGGSELSIVSSRLAGPWIITSDKVLKLDAAYRPQVFASLPPLLGAHYIAAACEDRAGALWIGTRSQGVHYITATGAEHVPTSHENVRTLQEDAEGNIWVGTNAGGLNAISPKIYRLYDKASGLVENANNAVCESSDGSIWSANGDGGVVRIDTNGVAHVTPHAEWPRLAVVTVAANPRGSIWLGGPPGLFELKSDLSEAPRLLSPAIPSGVRRLFVDTAGQAWLAVDPGRIGRWSPPGTYTTFGEKEGFVGGDVRCFAQDENGTIWVGTSRGRLFRWDRDRFTPVPFATRVATGAINAIHFEDDRSLWLGTAQAGIAVVRDGEARIVDVAAGAPENNITQLIADNHGFMWCGSGTGIFRLSRSEVKRFVAGEVASVNPISLGRDEGLRNISCTGVYFPGAIKARNGRIWFATRQGVLAIDPSAPLLSSHPRMVRIEEISTDTHSVPAAPVVTIQPQVNRLQIRFSVLCLSAPRRVHSEYRLDGFDPDWVGSGNSSVASYPRLRPGSYTFRVRAGTGATEGTQVEDSLMILVPALWWQNTWFTMAAILLALVAVTAGVRVWSTRRLRRRLRDLERERAVERERARIAENIHDDVGASLTHISLLTQAAVADNSPEKLNRIYEATRETTRSLDEIVWAVNPQHDTLESFAEYLGSNAQRFLNAASIRCRLEFPDQLPSAPLTSEVRHHLFLCCREAINNVVKHAHATEVVIQLSVTANELTVVVADDGGGIQVPGRSGRAGINSGNGLRNMMKRMEALGGTCEVAPASSRRGTTVTLRVHL